MTHEAADPEAAARRVPAEYVAYLRNHTTASEMEFMGLKISIDPGVFHPATDA